MKLLLLLLPFSILSIHSNAQLQWQNVTDQYNPLPNSVQVYKTESLVDGKPNIAYYLIADLKDKQLQFKTDTTYKRRLTPGEFYQKNEKALAVINTTFFSFQTHQNLNLIIKDKKLVAYNIHSLPGRGKDTLTWRHPLGSAIGIFKNRTADIAWTWTDSGSRKVLALQNPVPSLIRDSIKDTDFSFFAGTYTGWRKWKPIAAVGGGPVLVQNGEIMITNNEEGKFAGKAIDDKHPRSAMGYTADGKLVLLVVQGRMPGLAEGASLTQLAQMLKEIGCIEAMNLDGGGSSCLLINGKETIKPSDKEGQRAVPGVFLIVRRET
ncbi:MAG: phosphodiester glycosidase family protein [Chitinophagales bacterium]|nr:phosphodiester glycosidase family protein [Chitinophagales bacterium]